MSRNKQDQSLKKLRKYIADEAKRLGKVGGCVHQFDLASIEEDKECAIPGKPRNPLERDLDELFGRSGQKDNRGY